MHTVSGCYADNATQATGELTFNNCDHGVDANRGCTFVDPRNGSYGADFAAGGGGVYAAELASDGISVWFFPVRLFFCLLFAQAACADSRPPLFAAARRHPG